MEEKKEKTTIEKLRETPSIFEAEHEKKEEKPKTLKAIAVSGLRRKGGRFGFNLKLDNEIRFYPSNELIKQVFISIEDFKKL